MHLSNNTILITGGSAGIGLALAEEFVRLGNKVIVTGRSEAKLAAAKKQVPELETIRCDAGDPESIQAMAAQIEKDHPAMNVLINNAGIFLFKNLSGTSSDIVNMTQEIDINLSGPIRTTSVFIEMLKRNRGTVINVSSGLAFVPLMCAPVYCATKAGLHSYTIALRQQMSDYGVEVIELMPPAVKTDLTADLSADNKDFKMLTTDELVDATMAGLRAGKLEIRPGQANQLHFMSRLAPSFINAQLAKGSRSMVPEVEG